MKLSTLDYKANPVIHNEFTNVFEKPNPAFSLLLLAKAKLAGRSAGTLFVGMACNDPRHGSLGLCQSNMVCPAQQLAAIGMIQASPKKRKTPGNTGSHGLGKIFRVLPVFIFPPGFRISRQTAGSHRAQ